MLLSAIDFCERYVEFIEIVEQVVSPAYYPAIRLLYVSAPQDWIQPDDCFSSENEAIGFVFKQVISTQKRINNESTTKW